MMAIASVIRAARSLYPGKRKAERPLVDALAGADAEGESAAGEPVDGGRRLGDEPRDGSGRAGR